MHGDLGEVLTLLHVSSNRWQTLRGEGVEWRDEARSLEAFSRLRPRGSVISMRGTPGPADRDPRWQLWICHPDKARVDFGGAHQTRITQIFDGARTWMTMPGGLSRIHERRTGSPTQLGPATQLIETSAISAALALDVVGRTEILGRDAFEVRAHPREQELRPGPGFHPLLNGGDEVQLVVDAERGVVLRMEAFLGGSAFYRVEFTELAFDEEIPDERFRFPEADETDLGPPTPGQPPPNLRRRGPPSLHDGPPDNVIGQPAAIETVLVRADAVVVAVDRVVAYPTGFELHVTVRTHDEQLPGTTEPAHPRSWAGTAAFPGESLRMGVAFSDGRLALTDGHRAGATDRHLSLVPLSGSGTSCRFDQRFWVQPLPPSGPLGLIVEWSRRGLPETRVDVQADAIVEAASRATVLWERKD